MYLFREQMKMEKTEHQECPYCGKKGINFEWVNGVPVWKCDCGKMWEDTRWTEEDKKNARKE